MTDTWLVIAVMLLLVTGARAEPVLRTVMHEGAMYGLDIVDQTLTITFMEPPADLRELGAARGGILVTGKWSPMGVLEGEAYAFASGCAPIAYPVRGVVAQSGQLIVIGPQPTLQGCTVTGSQWTEGSIMRFTGARPIAEPRKSEPRAKAKDKPKPKPKPAARPQPRPQAPARSPWENQWQWQWR